MSYPLAGSLTFIHFGKCHGTIPGWYLVKEHPEMLDCFASFYLLPHVKGQTSNTWFDGLNQGIEHLPLNSFGTVWKTVTRRSRI